MIAEYDLTPHPLPSIPDNPPPHEGALFNLPYVVQPPDLVLVEVLEALPGRTISGERMVRPDGMISLGWYGDIKVSGLTLPQIKVAIIKHLRRFLDDEQLGLAKSTEDEVMEVEPPVGRPAVPPPPGNNPFDLGQAQAGEAQNVATEDPWQVIAPEASGNVYVDVTAYNSMSYYMQGDFAVPGRLPFTGNELVLDAVNYAGGLLSTADPKQLRLVRPQRNGQPAKVYKIDFEAIQDRGEVATNYQIFPGDRLVVGRDEVVKKTIEIDRLSAPIQSVVGIMLQEASMLRAMQTASPDRADQLYNELLDFWLKQLASRGELKFDEQTLREALLRKLKLTPPAAKQPAK